MKKTAIILTTAGLVLILAADSARADLFSLSKRDKSQRDTEVQAPRYDKYPTMSFFVGTLSRSGWTDWQIDDKQVEVAEPESAARNGSLPQFSEGSQAIIMGTLVGDRIVAHRVRLLDPQWTVPVADNQEDIRWSTTDPTVGEGTGPN